MRAMVLAAGRGERLLPLTLTVPKPAIPVLGRPLLVEILLQLVRSGIASVALNLHHLPDKVKALLGDGSDLGIEALAYFVEERILGTAGGVLGAAGFLRGRGTVLVRNSDFLADIDLRAAVARHRASGCPATLVVVPARPGYSTIEVDRKGRVLSLAGEPKVDPSRVAGRYLFTGCQLIENEVLDEIPPAGPSDLVRDVYRRLAGEGRLASFVHDGSWWEFGSLLDYLEGSLGLLDLPAERRTAVLDSDPVRKRGGATLALGPGADLHAGVEVRGRAAIGLATLVGEGTVVEDSVVMPEAWIGPGCRLRRAIVGPGTEVPAGFEAESALVCPDPGPETALPPDTERRDGLLLRRFGPRHG